MGYLYLFGLALIKMAVIIATQRVKTLILAAGIVSVFRDDVSIMGIQKELLGLRNYELNKRKYI